MNVSYVRTYSLVTLIVLFSTVLRICTMYLYVVQIPTLPPGIGGHYRQVVSIQRCSTIVELTM